MKKIVFTKQDSLVSDLYYPKKASEHLPEWYKNLYSYIGTNNKKVLDKNLTPASSIKRCIPVFDSMTSGYILSTYCDIWVSKNENNEIIYTTPEHNGISFHPISQAPSHPYMNNFAYPKWMNPWSIKTPKGYSLLFIPPVHGSNKYFQILEGIVDTDKYNHLIHLPFVLKDINFEGLIPAGTPVAQLIPIKRDIWKSKVGNKENQKNIEKHRALIKSTFFDGYKKFFWSKKEYR